MTSVSAAKTEVLPSPSRTIRLWFVSRICLHGQPRWTRDEFLVSSFKRRCHVSASHLPSHLPSGHLPASLGRWGNSLKHGLAKKKHGKLQKLNTKNQSYTSHMLQISMQGSTNLIRGLENSANWNRRMETATRVQISASMDRCIHFDSTPNEVVEPEYKENAHYWKKEEC